jgi:DNA-binding winged helix-turn-helix (wHTH) protein
VPASPIQFDEFSLDCDRFELLRSGRPIKLEKIPMELLILLASKDGNLVAREEIVERLWGKDVFVDTEHGINTAIRKIRLALRDDPEKPGFVQTVTGKGYRFVAELRKGDGAKSALPGLDALRRHNRRLHFPRFQPTLWCDYEKLFLCLCSQFSRLVF